MKTCLWTWFMTIYQGWLKLKLISRTFTHPAVTGQLILDYPMMTLLPDQIHSVQPVQQAHQISTTTIINCNNNNNNINNKLSHRKKSNSSIENQIGNYLPAFPTVLLFFISTKFALHLWRFAKYHIIEYLSYLCHKSKVLWNLFHITKYTIQYKITFNVKIKKRWNLCGKFHTPLWMVQVWLAIFVLKIWLFQKPISPFFKANIFATSYLHR